MEIFAIVYELKAKGNVMKLLINYERNEENEVLLKFIRLIRIERINFLRE